VFADGPSIRRRREPIRAFCAFATIRFCFAINALRRRRFTAAVRRPADRTRVCLPRANTEDADERSDV
jgi:hypothetical protein